LSLQATLIEGVFAASNLARSAVINRAELAGLVHVVATNLRCTVDVDLAVLMGRVVVAVTGLDSPIASMHQIDEHYPHEILAPRARSPLGARVVATPWRRVMDSSRDFCPAPTDA
jgi:hypothetical protein